MYSLNENQIHDFADMEERSGDFFVSLIDDDLKFIYLS